MAKTVLYIFTVSLVVLNLSLIYRYDKLKQASTLIADEYGHVLVKEKRVSNKMKKYSIFQQAMEGYKIPEIIIKNEEKDSLSFSSLFCDYTNPVLCFRFKDTHCDACIQHAIRMLNSISPKISHQIIVLSGYTNFRQFKAFESSQRGKLKTYNIEDISCWDIDNIEQSYFFILKDGKIHNVFIPLKEDDNYTQDYINTLIHKYWE